MEHSLDSNRRSDRAEWCTIYYHNNYCPDQSFSMELHWMVSTASIISERVSALLSIWGLSAAVGDPVVECSVITR